MTYEIDNDPDNEGFFSVFVYNGKGGGAEVAGKIGERAVAEVIVAALNAQQPLKLE